MSSEQPTADESMRDERSNSPEEPTESKSSSEEVGVEEMKESEGKMTIEERKAKLERLRKKMVRKCTIAVFAC